MNVEDAESYSLRSERENELDALVLVEPCLALPLRCSAGDGQQLRDELLEKSGSQQAQLVH